MNRLTLKPREERRVQRGHLWIYRNELHAVPPLDDGEIVDVYTYEQRFLARGFFQASGGIGVRALTFHQSEIDDAWLSGTIAQARALRETLFPGSQVYRWLHGESDGLPGLIADRYGDVVHVQSSCAFYAQRVDALAAAFTRGGDISGVLFQTSGKSEWRGQASDEIVCDFAGVKLCVDMRGGQKTGLFLDQRLNRKWLRTLAPGKRILDGHTYAGAWSIEAAMAGAQSVLGVDSSNAAIERARRNVALNDTGGVCAFEEADILEALRRQQTYDIIVLDPPALAKTRASVEKALGLYQVLNRDAIKSIAPGGYLITSSCSHFVDVEKFREMLKRAARSAERHCTVLAFEGASPDHPVLMEMPETEYLKCAVLQVL
jgi:23S rRNA (cytosine1962-C5)-methyltransferase